MRKLNISFEELVSKAIKEGVACGMELHSGSVIAPSSGSATVSAKSLVPTECMVVTSMGFSIAGASKATVQTTMYNGPSNNSVGETSLRFALNNSAICLPVSLMISPGSTVSCVVRDGDGTSALAASCNIGGYTMTADLNFNADKVMLWIGDSITRGTTLGGTAYSNYNNTLTSVSPEDHFTFQVRNHFQRRGIDCRLVLKAMGSYTSRMMGYWVRNGWLDIDQCDVVFYQMGVNDATGSTTDQQFTDELNRVIDWRDRKHPLAKIVFVGASPLNNSTSETRLSTLRGLMSGIANTSGNIYYLSLATAFDRTVLSNYTSSDGTHPNIASNAAMATVINNWITANNFLF